MRRWRSLVLLLAALAVLVACSGDDPTVAGPERTSTTATAVEERPSTTPAPTTTEPGVVPGPALPATGTCPAVPARRTPAAERPQYRLDVRVDLAAGVVDGTVDVVFTPDLDVDRLVFRLWPNGPRPAAAGARLDVGPVSVDGAPPRHGHVPDPTTLDVPLPRPVAAGEPVRASLPWTLRLPGAANDRLARIGDTVRLGSFFPILAWESGAGWAREPATSLFAEASTAPVADFDLGIAVPPGLDVLASGTRTGDRWRAVAMRDVALSVGRFRTVEATAMAPEPVHVVVAVEAGLPDDERAYLDTTVRALEDFAGRYGPYPWPTHTLAVTPGLAGGIEYPGHVLQGPGTGGRTTPHEVAHLWFYALVGNNQGRDPWLDEGLATWAEARFLGALDRIRTTAIPPAARGRVGAPMTYWEQRPRSYYRGVYVQGAQVLDALGPPELVDCALRHYVAANAFTVAEPADLVAALRTVFADVDGTLARYGVAS